MADNPMEASNPYIDDVHQGPSEADELAGNPYVASAAQGGSGSTVPNSSSEGRTAPSEFGTPTSQDTARHSTTGPIAHYQN